jgi:hypothetical protein
MSAHPEAEQGVRGGALTGRIAAQLGRGAHGAGGEVTANAAGIAPAPATRTAAATARILRVAVDKYLMVIIPNDANYRL